ncbi:DEAD/DEAH box helicase [Kineococcus glutinatus]|uniref:Helicase ATP-binding domain-containing protein n=1 Tax=Kineococcus glutinatus TaxID=1070872 RepID=A0ABP9HFC8_9ACTN
MPEAKELDFGQRLATFGSSTFTSLRPGQKLVLDEYAANHLSTSDVAIEMPTGEGKTLVALLIADWALEQGRSVAYLTGTRQLAERVEREAELLGLDVVRFAARNYGGAKLDDYHQAEKPGIMNYWVYFNSSPVPQPADLLILDDAHLAEQPLSGLRTLRIPNKPGEARKLYESVCDLVLAHAGDAYPALRAMREGVAAPGTPPELLSFGDWANVAVAVRDAISDSPYAEEAEIKHVWRTVQAHLTRCGVLIGSSAVEIRPYHPPTQQVAGYAQAKQRIYLSATLGSMDDLQRRIGGGRITRLTPTAPLPAGATGHRQLILNPTGKSALDEEVLEWALEQVAAADGRAAWLCASNGEADLLEKALEAEGARVFRLRAGDDDQVEAWIAASRGHLVTAGRYDGLDLPGDLCKLVIITTVPQASSEYERFVVAYLGDATFMRHRVGQRVTQALGRANRTPSDRSLYLGLDPTFAQMLADPAVRKSVPADATPIIRGALELFDKGWQATQDACTAFWVGSRSTLDEAQAAPTSDQGARARRLRPGRVTSGSGDVASAPAEVAAATSLWLGDHAAAAQAAKQASVLLAESGETEHAAFWRYVEAHAHFDRGRVEDRAAARAALDDAINKGPQTAWFRRLARTSAALAGAPSAADDNDRLFLTWDDWRREAGGRLDRALSRGRDLLTGNHDQQCEGLIHLARLAGADGERPPRTEQSATDCRWSWSTPGRSQRRIWEVKTAQGKDSGEGRERKITRTDVNQLLGQLEVESKRAPKARLTGCLLDPATEAHGDATDAARDRIRLISHDAAVRLYDLLADRLRTYAAMCGDGSAEARGQARAHVEALLPAAGWLAQLLAPSPQGRILSPDEVAALFPAR